MTVEQLQRDGWPTAEQIGAGQQARFETLFAEVAGAVVGFALFFHNYSTWEGMGVYLEDLYVKPEHRGKGIGTALVEFCLHQFSTRLSIRQALKHILQVASAYCVCIQENVYVDHV